MSDTSRQLAQRSLIWHYPNNWTGEDGPGINYSNAIHQGDWKLIFNMRDGRVALYNLRTDIQESADLSGKHPDKVKQLTSELGRRLREWNARMPFIKSTGKTVATPDAWH